MPHENSAAGSRRAASCLDDIVRIGLVEEATATGEVGRSDPITDADVG